MQPRKILVVDDHVAVLHGLRLMLQSEYPAASIAAVDNAASALKEAGTGDWGLGIVDLSLEGRNGLDLLKELRALQPGMPIVVYTMHPESQFGVRSLQAGANGFVTKDQPAEELFEAIRTVLSGKRFVSPALADALAAFVAQPSNPLDLLSDREHQILLMIARGQTVSEIGDELNLSIKTVSTYRTRVLEKLKLHSTADLVRFAIHNQLA
jgi:two-component system, NarL family, invasion response regulator UvrY